MPAAAGQLSVRTMSLPGPIVSFVLVYLAKRNVTFGSRFLQNLFLETSKTFRVVFSYFLAGLAHKKQYISLIQQQVRRIEKVVSPRPWVAAFRTRFKACFHYGCAALRCAARCERSSQRQSAISLVQRISLHIAHYRSQRAAQRSAAVMETGLYYINCICIVIY